MQKYLPTALRYETGLASGNNGTGPYQSLLVSKPWYSLYGNDLFSDTTYVTNLCTGTISSKNMGISPHILGLRNYELNNHLGNPAALAGQVVQATVLDRVTTVKVPKQLQVFVVGPPLIPTGIFTIGTTPAPPTPGNLPLASTFKAEKLYAYHYIADNALTAEVGASGEGQNYQLSLSSEPSGISSYMHLHLDTGLRTQDFGFEMSLPANVVGEMRVRQYDMAGSERYSDAIRWTRLNNTGLQNFTLAVTVCDEKDG